MTSNDPVKWFLVRYFISLIYDSMMLKIFLTNIPLKNKK